MISAQCACMILALFTYHASGGEDGELDAIVAERILAEKAATQKARQAEKASSERLTAEREAASAAKALKAMNDIATKEADSAFKVRARARMHACVYEQGSMVKFYILQFTANLCKICCKMKFGSANFTL